MKYLIEEATLTGIADAVREKKGTTDLIQVSNLATEISNIQGGGTVEELTITSNGTYNPPTGIDGFAPVVVNVPQDGAPPENAFAFIGDCSGLFKSNRWKWFLDMYGKQITINAYNIQDIFRQCDITEIPIDTIYLSNDSRMNYAFYNCYKLTKVPRIIITENLYSCPDMSSLFRDCSKLREIPYDYFTSMTNKWSEVCQSQSNGDKGNLFDSCYSLRTHPDMACLEQVGNYSGGSVYNSTFSSCYSLDEVINYPVAPGEIYYDQFDYFVSYCKRLKNLIFRTNEDGSPVITKWKNQTIDLTSGIGYTGGTAIVGRNNGITADKEVKDDATYQALKDDPDWFSADINYSRYNHNSAVRTINSLPDTSAYLATAGGTNTIKFKGESGALTDGGAINTLTEEEIAVATAKGWTVSLV